MSFRLRDPQPGFLGRPWRPGGAVFIYMLFLASLATPSALAQTADPARGLDINLLKPTPFAHNGIVTDNAAQLEQWDYSVSLLFHHALNPLIWRNPDNTDTLAISHSLFGELLGHVAFTRWLALGSSLPLALYTRGEDLRGLSPAPAGVALGDFRLALKALALDQHRHYINLGLIAEIAFPTGQGRAYVSSGSIVGSPRLVISRRFQWFELAVNLGARIRAGQELFGNLVATQLTYNVMASALLPWRPSGVSFEIIGELWGLTAATRPFTRLGENILEWMLSVRVGVLDKIFVTLGLGGGFLQGYGSPDFRTALGISWAPKDPDRDFDGRPDSRDRCPDEPEMYNGVEDDDGCPELDRDGDGIIDWLDRCPLKKENVNGYKDDDGCPDKKKPTCVEAPVDADSEDEPSEAPECDDVVPEVPASQPAPPIPGDRDRDGLGDEVDKCPDQPETINGFDDHDGCPDKGKPATVFISKEGIKILEKINFEVNSSVIKQESYNVIDQVVAQMRAHPEVKKLRIEGHTDADGADAYNLRLSQGRSDSVKAYMMQQGIEANRLSAVGYGETRPIASNKTPRGKAQNRRVEFVIVEQDD